MTLSALTGQNWIFRKMTEPDTVRMIRFRKLEKMKIKICQGAGCQKGSQLLCDIGKNRDPSSAEHTVCLGSRAEAAKRGQSMISEYDSIGSEIFSWSMTIPFVISREGSTA